MVRRAAGSVGQDLPRRVAMLMDPRVYEDHPVEVMVNETELSWVFLTGEFAYKLKKPVGGVSVGRDGLEERRRQSEEDVRLNRRLAPDVYLGVVPLAEDSDGRLTTSGRGVAVDWLVKMRRLPADGMLDKSIRTGGPSNRELRFVTGLLTRFFKAALPIAVPPMEYRRRLADTVTASRRALAECPASHAARSVEMITAALRKFIMGQPSLIDRRVRRGCVREGHGDLRPANVFLGPKAAVIDCVDHDPDMRILDFADELSLLAIECEILGDPGPGKTVMDACCDRLGNVPEPEMIAFYKARRALMCARQAAKHRVAHVTGGNGRGLAAVDTWLALAARYARQIE